MGGRTIGGVGGERGVERWIEPGDSCCESMLGEAGWIGGRGPRALVPIVGAGMVTSVRLGGGRGSLFTGGPDDV